MGIDFHEVLFGTSILLKKLTKKRTPFNFDFSANIFSSIYAIDSMINYYGAKLESVANINIINNNSFMDYELIKNNDYNINSIIPYGSGWHFNNCTLNDYRMISLDKLSVNNSSLFSTNHIINKMITPFIQSVIIDDFEGIVNIENFKLNDYNLEVSSENFSPKIVALTGHVHKNGLQINLNDCEEYFFCEDFFLENVKQIHDFIKLFRKWGEKITSEIPMKNFEYSHFLFSNQEKYYYYSESTSISLNNHHNRFGIITELTPNEHGVSCEKISKINYFESLNILKEMQELCNYDEFNSADFISEKLLMIQDSF